MNIESTYDLIEGYLNNTLSAATKAEVEVKLQNDPAFYQEVEAHRAVSDIISDNAAIDIKKKLQKIHAENTSAPKSNNRNLYYGVAAAVVGLSIVATLVFQDKEENKSVINKISQPNTDSVSINNDGKSETGSSINNNDKSTFVFNPKKREGKTIIYPEDGDMIIEGAWDTTGNIKLTEYLPQSAYSPDKQVEDKVDNNTTIQSKEINKCEGVIIDISYSAISTCIGQKNGAVVFDKASLDTESSYEFSIDGGKTFNTDSKFDKLGIGNYTLIIKDQNGCKSKTVVAQIEKETCDYIIVPSRQNYWEVPLQKFANESVTLKITDGKTGRIVFAETISGGNYTWNGVDESGTELPMGVYVYELSAPANTDLPLIKGSVTIAR